ncbi:hypothetical protein M595_4768 [Lyngbya aestuarii BL J]|uniref:Uncharacterized protein n=1 Tax=Lyngbya aestuarii BL J TaxID=1348334 RepID=U7QDG5_9CYAN|nr:hypothetical protein M595_4768 [Lyngbya aestuarii BL J]
MIGVISIFVLFFDSIAFPASSVYVRYILDLTQSLNPAFLLVNL